MSQENVEVVRRSLDHFNATGEFLWDAIDPEVEWVIDPTGLLAGTYRGHEGMKMFLARIDEGFDQIPVGDDQARDEHHLRHVLQVAHRDEVFQAVDRANRNRQRQHHRESRVDGPGNEIRGEDRRVPARHDRNCEIETHHRMDRKH